MKATEQYFPVVLFILLYSDQVNDIEPYFCVVLLVLLLKKVLTNGSEWILKNDHEKENSWVACLVLFVF